ncbi:hypothetical protein CLAFUW4_02327 [Fulvia fulva]|uniref:Uncharacterized protein n=1 Tax=Passalora fulva TaxID=5499 RepID=A0A9Q8L8Q4_PASFU|nr:uncharacterized protein CLAFUR5_02316 [Fulvia fulva]KAK4634338.1 hypothetical protein CLAFUR4_02322 [Fulvia fulva]KAK4637118.1 hypothetical protein CLAFUR0_02326 [Fulvia fulva]UJO12996.1 hypothetical protein CLAFUR5_02316 [Fulvia fulva]WPV10276.1 hypothetical protein CLAFUW4_02327 [Fulvia fulva]WPV24014.1 hypothetical protein CLAFUW7_02327 [Fulvia fulva]
MSTSFKATSLPRAQQNGKQPKAPHSHRTLFDYIFSRLLILVISNWPSFIAKELSLLKPGGWAEIQDLAWDWLDPSGSITSSSWQWLELMNSRLHAKGMDTHCGSKAAKWMEAAGFEEVQVSRARRRRR